MEQEGVMKKEELKPCPFCGKSVKMIIGPMFGLAMVYCNNCGSRTSFENGEDQKSATKMWNRRAE